MLAVLLPVFHHTSCFLDVPLKRLDAFWRKKKTAVPRFPNQSPTTKLHSSHPKKKRGRQPHQSQQDHPTPHQAHKQTIHKSHPESTPRIPTTIRILHLTEFIKSIDTPSFDTHRFVLSFLPFSFSSSAHLFAALLVHLPSSFFVFHIFPQPTAQVIFLMHSLVLSDTVSFFTNILPATFLSGEIP